MDPRVVIKSPVITEKGTDLQKENKYCFAVDRRANKIQIKKAVEEIFKVKAVKVNTVKMHGKRKRVRHREGKTPDWKKAIVTLREGDKIGLV
ncbi:50S ribosomal protein L23 [bacterium]|nr:50S ribosomal protein L23 [bacterium]